MSIECAAKRERTKTPAEATTREGPSLVIRVPLTTGALPAPYHTFYKFRKVAFFHAAYNELPQHFVIMT